MAAWCRCGGSHPAAAAVTRAELGIGTNGIVFGTFVSMVKLSRRCLSLWRTILERVRNAIEAYLRQSRLADPDRYTRALEAAYERALAFKLPPTN